VAQVFLEEDKARFLQEKAGLVSEYFVACLLLLGGMRSL